MPASDNKVRGASWCASDCDGRVLSIMSDEQKNRLKKEIDKLLKSDLAKASAAG